MTRPQTSLAFNEVELTQGNLSLFAQFGIDKMNMHAPICFYPRNLYVFIHF